MAATRPAGTTLFFPSRPMGHSPPPSLLSFFCLLRFVFFVLLLLSVGPFSRPPRLSSESLFLGGSFIYLFFWAGGRSLSLGAAAGWPLARLDVERSCFEYFCPGYTDLPRLPAECTWRVGTHLTSAGPQTSGTVTANNMEPLAAPSRIPKDREFCFANSVRPSFTSETKISLRRKKKISRVVASFI